MGGGFNTNARGIEIDITKTLKKYDNNNHDISKESFENYLKRIGLNSDYRDDNGEINPIFDGYVISFDLNGDNGEDAYALLSTGSWEYQNWVMHSWSIQSIKDQNKFNNLNLLNNDIKNHLIKKWSGKLVLLDDFTIHSVGCEWANKFYEIPVAKMQNGENNENINVYYSKYLKYKIKYLNLNK